MSKSKYLKIAIKAAKKSGRLLIKEFKKPAIISFKAKHEIVTESDHNSEDKIIKIISKKFPNHSFWSEEKGEINKNSKYRWVIDPIDGTLNFSQKIPFFGISIALEENGKSVVGVTYFPELKRMYYAEKGKGSFMNGKQIHVSTKKTEENLFFIISTEILRKAKLIDQFRKQLNDRSLHMVSFGSCALAMSFVADGSADACYEFGIKPCDISAGILIIKEAGGKVVNFKGKNATSNDKEVIASNGLLKLRLK